MTAKDKDGNKLGYKCQSCGSTEEPIRNRGKRFCAKCGGHNMSV